MDRVSSICLFSCSEWFYQGCQVDHGALVVLIRNTSNRYPPSVLYKA